MKQEKTKIKRKLPKNDLVGKTIFIQGVNDCSLNLNSNRSSRGMHDDAHQIVEWMWQNFPVNLLRTTSEELSERLRRLYG